MRGVPKLVPNAYVAPAAGIGYPCAWSTRPQATKTRCDLEATARLKS